MKKYLFTNIIIAFLFFLISFDAFAQDREIMLKNAINDIIVNPTIKKMMKKKYGKKVIRGYFKDTLQLQLTDEGLNSIGSLIITDKLRENKMYLDVDPDVIFDKYWNYPDSLHMKSNLKFHTDPNSPVYLYWKGPIYNTFAFELSVTRESYRGYFYTRVYGTSIIIIYIFKENKIVKTIYYYIPRAPKFGVL